MKAAMQEPTGRWYNACFCEALGLNIAGAPPRRSGGDDPAPRPNKRPRRTPKSKGKAKAKSAPAADPDGGGDEDPDDDEGAGDVAEGDDGEPEWDPLKDDDDE